MLRQMIVLLCLCDSPEGDGAGAGCSSSPPSGLLAQDLQQVENQAPCVLTARSAVPL